jgi:glycosyltransferase involved in cell wall biosynthesis
VNPLTVTIIAANEADRIARAIESVSFADEVLVVDSGSSDETVAIAKALGARVIETDWPGYRVQKNRAADWAKNDWVLGLDADEYVDDVLAASIQTVLKSPGAAGFEIDRQGHWMGAPIDHGTWRPDRSVRLFDRRRAKWSGGSVHERVVVEGPTERLVGDIQHFPFRDIGEQLADIQRYASLFVADAKAAGRRARLVDVMVRPFAHFMKALVIRQGFRDGVRGWCLAGIGATAVMLKWGMLYLDQETP